MKLGRVFGIILIAFGGFMSWMAYSTLDEVGATLKLFTFGPGLITMGIGLILFPGGDITAKESREKTKTPDVMFKEAPKSHKIAWGIFLVVGFIISQYIF